MVRNADEEVTSEGEELGGFAWPHMTFVLVDGCKASHHGYRLATMTLMLFSHLSLNSLAKGYIYLLLLLYKDSLDPY